MLLPPFHLARRVAHSVLLDCSLQNAHCGPSLDYIFRREPMKPAVIAHATAVVYGVLRHRSLLDFALAQLTSLDPIDESCRTTLRIGAFEMLVLNVDPSRAVSGAVQTQSERWAKGLANGVLRSLSEKRQTLLRPEEDERLSPIQALAVRRSLPEWLLVELEGRLGWKGVKEWARQTAKPPPLALRTNPVQAKASQVEETLKSHGISTRRWMPNAERDRAMERSGTPLLIHSRGHSVPSIPGYSEGWWSVQDAASQLATRLAAPPPHALVLDMCAAPGGKACHLAQHLADTGKVLAVDINAHKLKRVQKQAERLRLRSVSTAHMDATDAGALSTLLEEHGGARNASAADLLSIPTGKADCVMLDAPCSGLGTLRRNPECRYTSQDDVRELSRLQDRLLDAAAKCVLPGGSLTYTVCTPTVAEGPERVKELLRRRPGWFEVEEIPTALKPFAGSLAQHHDDSSTSTKYSCINTWTHLHDECDTFFAVKLKRSLKSQNE
ncbi:hypothetical protein AB1Y20_023475 [Prymnesium parvum]|uniref:SAM-dependent MTase RsmB/NOP-type domain-containing protein n=1 Tax=Prymnesium parvum TaxID=97485 RepID=A0AB34JEV3_PRYPA|mmetsp:Transcript_10381/g.23154  ORF Transcript_10381/g.23154 Transcript_10381/m.23154 type:complete len:497 (-) Transcript_10381:32-1522(-)